MSTELLGSLQHPKPCVFCIEDPLEGTGPNGVEPERILEEYESWWLILQPEPKRNITIQSAGLLVAKRALTLITEATPEEFGEIVAISHDAADKLCQAVNTVYTGHFRGAHSEGEQAGQTVAHAHYHILPVSEEDPEPLKMQASGIGSAYTALRTQRLG